MLVSILAFDDDAADSVSRFRQDYLAAGICSTIIAGGSAPLDIETASFAFVETFAWFAVHSTQTHAYHTVITAWRHLLKL